MEEEKTAVWIRYKDPDEDELFRCSHCNMIWFLAIGDPIENEMFFCPKCGYSMEKVIDE